MRLHVDSRTLEKLLDFVSHIDICLSLQALPPFGDFVLLARQESCLLNLSQFEDKVRVDLVIHIFCHFIKGVLFDF